MLRWKRYGNYSDLFNRSAGIKRFTETSFMKLEDHPTVRRLAARGEDRRAAEKTLDGGWLRRLALACGAHDSGLVELARPGLDSERDEILKIIPGPGRY